MNTTSMALGATFVVIGLVVAVVRQTRPAALGKLGRMQQTWGEGAGWWVHFVFYTVMPILAGAVFMFAGTRGVAVL